MDQFNVIIRMEQYINGVLTVLAVSMSIIKHSTALTLYVTGHICCPCHYEYVSTYIYMCTTHIMATL